MKLLEIIFIFFALLGISCSTNEIIIAEEDIPESVFYLRDQIKPYTGSCLVYYHNTDKLKEKMQFKKGMLDGEHLSYYKSGQLKRRGYYVMGNMEGKWTCFDSKGNKTLEVEYKSDTLLGTFISWHSTGVIKQIGKYQNNIPTGNWTCYDQAGMIIQ